MVVVKLSPLLRPFTSPPREFLSSARDKISQYSLCQVTPCEWNVLNTNPLFKVTGSVYIQGSKVYLKGVVALKMQQQKKDFIVKDLQPQ